MGLVLIQLSTAFNGSLSTDEIVTVAFDESPVTISPASNSLFRSVATNCVFATLVNLFTVPTTSLATTRIVSPSNKVYLGCRKVYLVVLFVQFFVDYQ